MSSKNAIMNSRQKMSTKLREVMNVLFLSEYSHSWEQRDVANFAGRVGGKQGACTRATAVCKWGPSPNIRSIAPSFLWMKNFWWIGVRTERCSDRSIFRRWIVSRSTPTSQTFTRSSWWNKDETMNHFIFKCWRRI